MEVLPKPLVMKLAKMKVNGYMRKYAKINVKSNHFLFLTSLESPLNKGGSEGVWKYRWLHFF